LIVRHPCAVLASWLNRGWRLNSWIKTDPELLIAHPELSELLSSLRHDEEYFAARWCIDHYVPMVNQGASRCNIVAYEKLVTDGADYLEEVLGFWNIDMPDQVRSEIRRPSEKASQSMKKEYESVLSGWKSTLETKQIERVLRVVRDFGLDFYGPESEPDYDRLFGARPVRSGVSGTKSK